MPENSTLLETPPAGGGEPNPNPAASAKETAPGFVNSDGSFANGWLDQLPEDMAPAKETLGKFRNVHDLGKAHWNLQQLLGRKSAAVLVPTAESTPEEVAAYRKALGVPEKSDEYKIKPEQLPEGVEWSDELMKGYVDIAHKHNIPPAALREMAGVMVQNEAMRMQETAALAEREMETGKKGLQEAWGDKYQANIGKAKQVAATVGLDPESPGLRDPSVIKALVRMSELVAEDKLVTGDAFSPTSQPGKARAKAIMTGDTTDPQLILLHQKYKEEDPDTIAYVRKLNQHG